MKKTHLDQKQKLAVLKNADKIGVKGGGQGCRGPLHNRLRMEETT